MSFSTLGAPNLLLILINKICPYHWVVDTDDVINKCTQTIKGMTKKGYKLVSTMTRVKLTMTPGVITEKYDDIF